MSALEVFRYEGRDIRTVVINGEPWFVASDVAEVLGYRDAHDMVRTLDEDETGTHLVRTPGGEQMMRVISEGGVFRVIIQRQSGRVAPTYRDAIKQFQRWVTHEVLPSIRRTGSYVVPETREQLLARAVIEANTAIAEAHQEIEALTPRAEAWDELASAAGDYEVADAAKILARAGVETGRQRLFAQLADLGWIFRSPAGKWKAKQSAVDSGYLAEKPQSHHHPRTGELVLDAPQVRVTIHGIERLRVRLGALV
ncbi:Phage antirepressor protein KilAC domain protein [Microbacterium hydrocarbonoxydans]|uniref:Phage antirepressor protein KilAC domain protein n=1 Tax=Microbacterium hydrocarbonoxydans TaxID=273678 RepID=A0A0M2HYJ9_9MICO|nr:phage antirepressor KilAC domain-containing protein [Microbacterium hydrocarbonoxydans]KJL49504.1 Phage antirepressor protein KilAC domain protein [Microbacterium hydrocarbonoxydans]